MQELGTEERLEVCFIALQSASNFLGSHLFLAGVTYAPLKGGMEMMKADGRGEGDQWKDKT